MVIRFSTVLTVTVAGVWISTTCPAADYYVNDPVTTNDVWCTAPGAVTNDGQTAATPAASIRQVLEDHDLAGGDVVYVDHGNYALDANTVVGLADGGLPGSPVTIRGVGTGTVLDRGGTGGGRYGFHVNGTEHVRIEDLRVTDASQAVRLENSDYVTVADCTFDACENGVVLSAGNFHTIQGCTIHSQTGRGVLGSSSSAATIRQCEIHHSQGGGAANQGIELSNCGSAVITGNTIRDNNYHGIYLISCALAQVTGNTIHGNGQQGVYLVTSSSAQLVSNTVHSCRGGLYAYNSPSLTVEFNRSSLNTDAGLTIQYAAADVLNNLAYANGASGIDLYNAGGSRVENNTLYHNAPYQLRLQGTYANAEIRNNILVSEGPGQTCMQVESLGETWFSDFNDFQATGGALVWHWLGSRYTLGSWQHYADKDRHSLDVDPRFVDPGGPDGLLGGAHSADDDFHLQSTSGSYHGGAWTPDGADSACIDAGDPVSAVGDEPPANGSRVNLGAYGGSAEASKSSALRTIQVLHPNGGGIHFRRVRVRWAVAGPWSTNDEVKIEYSPDNGGNWIPCLNANPLQADNSLYGWDLTGISTGTQFRMRVTYLGDTNVVDVSDATFEVQGPNPKIFYVNDSSTTDDRWCSATGAYQNTGLTPASPVESAQSIVDRYPEIGAGDEFRIDTGIYAHGRTVFLRYPNTGAPGSPLVFRGSGMGSGTTLDAGSLGYHAMYLEGLDHLRFQDLTLTGGGSGLYLTALDYHGCDDVIISNCVFTGNTGHGLYIGANANHGGDDLTLIDCRMYDNDGSGIHIVGGGDGGDRVDISRCESHDNGGRGLYLYSGGDGGDDVRVTDCDFDDNGSTGLEYNGTGLSGRHTGVVVTDCRVRGNANHGMLLYSSTNLLVQGHEIVGNGSMGLYSGACWGEIRQNTVSSNYFGIRTTGYPMLVAGNEVIGSSDWGMQLESGATAEDNRVSLSGSHGMLLYYGSHARQNVVNANSGHGLWVEGSGNEVVNNLIHDNGDSTDEYNIYTWESGYQTAVTIENNTIHGGNGIYVRNGDAETDNVVLRNNIVWATGSGRAGIHVHRLPVGGDILDSDYNDLYATDGAGVGHWLGLRTTLKAWQQVSSRDPNSIPIEPLFVNAPTDYHLQSTAGSYKGLPFTAPTGGVFAADAAFSFCVDAGHPSSTYAQESPDNGGRVNIGAFGNTADASRSPGSPAILVAEPNGGEKWFGVQTVTWLTRGPWLSNDTVTIEVSDDGGGAWSGLTNDIDFAAGAWDWDTSGATPGSNYLLRITRTGDAGTTDQSDTAFEISASGPRTFYVNDGSTTGDVYCAAAGDDLHDGLTPSTPKASVQSVLDTYNVGGGDTIRIDTGHYGLSAAIVINTNDQGEAGNPVTIVGNTNALVSVLDGQAAGNHVLFLDGASHIRILSLVLTNGSSGLYVWADTPAGCDDLRVTDCRATGNSGYGFVLGGSNHDGHDDVEIVDCELDDNGTDGLYVYGGNSGGCDRLTVRECRIHDNGNDGIEMGALDWNRRNVDVAISGCEIRDNYNYGIYAYHSSNVLFSANVIERQTGNAGVRFNTCTGELHGNEVRQNYYGVWVQGYGMLVAGGEVSGNSDWGMQLESACTAEGIRVFGNGSYGMVLYHGSDARRNVVYSNGGQGMWVQGTGNEVSHNLVYDNGDTAGEYNIYTWESGYRTDVTIENNTIYGGNGIYVRNGDAETDRVVLRNNIIWATGPDRAGIRLYRLPIGGDVFDSDFNILVATGGGSVGYWNGRQPTLKDWQHTTGRDGQSISRDPLFVDLDGVDGTLGGTNGWDDNFHLGSTVGSYTGLAFTAQTTAQFPTNAEMSACVDAGDPSSAVTDELAPHGSRVNIGAFGGTTDASLSLETREIELTYPLGGEALRGVATVSWVTRGPWMTGDTVRLRYSDDGGSSWAQVTDAASVPYELGTFDWDTSAFTPGSAYRLEAAKSDDAGVAFTGAVFQVLSPGPRTFYVNDGGTSNDVYCSTIGSDANDGLTASTPKGTVKGLLQEYALVPGDLVKIDTGTWTLDATLDLVDSGSAAQRITFLGSTHPDGSVLSCAGAGPHVVLLNEVDYVRLESLRLTGGYHGIVFASGYHDGCDGIEIVDCELYANSADGLYVYGGNNGGCDGLRVQGCQIHDNGDDGIEMGAVDWNRRNLDVEITGCGIRDNDNHGIYAYYSSNVLFSANVIERQTGNAGVRFNTCTGELHGNEVRQNYYGVWVHGYGMLVAGGEVSASSDWGMQLESGSTAEGIRVFGNGSYGMVLYHGSDARRNVVYSNNGHGVWAQGTGNELHNNLVYNNGDTADEYNIYTWESGYRTDVTIENNTTYGGNGIYVRNGDAETDRVVLRNNIIWATGPDRTGIRMYRLPYGADVFESDFNNLIGSDGGSVGYWHGHQATLADWQYVTGRDAQSIGGDPLFVDLGGADGTLGGTNGWDDNFHLGSTVGSYTGLAFTAQTTAQFPTNAEMSACVDAGDPSSAATDELAPHGSRVNIGAFGGTADASLSLETREIELTRPVGGEALRGVSAVSWLTRGPWMTGDTVRLRYSDNGGSSWAQVPNAESVPFEMGTFDWDTSALTPGSAYRLEAAKSDDAGVASTSGVFRVLSPGPRTFYVNDGSTSNDVYCSTMGSDANDGLTASTPKGTVKGLLQEYALVPGDLVKIDTGTWTLEATLVLVDSGSAAQPITFLGSTHPDGSVLSCAGAGPHVVLLSEVDYVRLESLKLTGGYHGIAFASGYHDGCDAIEIVDCELYANSADGLYVYGGNNGGCDELRVQDCQIHDNGDDGIEMGAVDWNRRNLDVEITGCGIRDNDNQGIYAYYSSNVLFGANVIERQTGNAGMRFNTCTGELRGNEVRQNYYGVWVHGYGMLVADGEVSGSTDWGMQLENGCTAEGIRVFGNSSYGMILYNGSDARRNVVYSNGGQGIWVQGTGNEVSHNLVYDNGDTAGEYNIYTWESGYRTDVTIENNTLYGGNGIYVRNGDGINDNVVLRNNVIWGTGSARTAIYLYRTPSGGDVFDSDYNTLYASDEAVLGYWGGTAAADLSAWQALSGRDANSLGTDPLFVDPDGGDDLLGGLYAADDDFHLQSVAGSFHVQGGWLNDLTNSPCIDKGDPGDPYANEPDYNGLRINQGVFGNTDEASKTDYGGVFYTLTTAVSPASWGAVHAWPVAAAYPTNVEVELVGAPGIHFTWDHWTGDLAGTANPTSFYVTADMTVTGVFDALSYNTYGVPNWWLAQHGMPTNQAACEGDPDLDGHFTWQEWLTDTVPTNGDSVLKVIGLAVSNGTATVEWKGGVEAWHVLERSDDLAAPSSWTPIFTNDPPTSVTNVSTQAAGAAPHNYRLRAGRP